jgi:hypothetical protein
VIAAVLVVLFASLFALYRSMTRPNPGMSSGLAAAAPETTQQHMAGVYSSQGVMTVQSYQRLAAIQTTIYRTGKITPADLQWALTLLHSKPVLDGEDNELTLHRTVFLYLSGLKPLPQPEENELFTAVLPYVSDTNPYVRKMAVATLAETGDLRALPYLQKMQRDPDPQVQQYADEAIKSLQKHATQNSASQNSASPLR